MKLPATPTPVAPRELADALRARWGSPAPSDDAIALAAAQSALECGWWTKCFCWNLGNSKSDGAHGDWTYYPCGENLPEPRARRLVAEDPAHVSIASVTNGIADTRFLPEHPMCRFRAFTSLAAAVDDHLAMMRSTFPRSWAVLQTGDAVAFGHMLRAEGYYTADRDQYSHTLVDVLSMVRAKLAMNPPPAVPRPAPPIMPAPPALPAWMLALRTPLPGETPGQHVARIVRAFEGVSLAANADRLRALFSVNETADRAPSMAALTTNCGTFLREAWCLAGCPDHFVTQPYQSGMAVTWDLEAARELGALVDCRQNPDAWRMLSEGWGLHYGTPGSNNDHMEICLGTPDPRTARCKHGGGGRAQNAITLGEDDVRWSLGRPLLHVIDPGKLQIPTAPPAPLTKPDRPGLPGLISSADTDDPHDPHDAETQPSRPPPPPAPPPAVVAPPSTQAARTRRAGLTTGAASSVAAALAFAREHWWVVVLAIVLLALAVAAYEWWAHRARPPIR